MVASSIPHYPLLTSGETDPVWVHLDPPYNRPAFPTLENDVETDVCIIGAGVAGISLAYELVSCGVNVLLVEAREVLSGETGRTSGHLSNALDDRYTEIAKKLGQPEARLAAESHTWAINRVEEIAKALRISCEFRRLPAYAISQYPRGHPKRDGEVEDLKIEAATARDCGLSSIYEEGYVIKGWDGKHDQRGVTIFSDQATFHPTLYFNGVLRWLKQQENFSCVTHTKITQIEEEGMGVLSMGHRQVKVQSEDGHTIKCNHAVEATCVPLQKSNVIAEMEYFRTYCIAIRVPKGKVEDCLLYDSADKYKYLRITDCDAKDDYLIVGGCDHKVGQDEPTGRFGELERWARERFTKTGTVDYRWSGQIFEPSDCMAFIGKNPLTKRTYLVTGDSGNGLTHGVIAGKLIADEIRGISNRWAKLYAPSRVESIFKSAATMMIPNIENDEESKRFVESDIRDIEDLPFGSGGVLNRDTDKPIAVYKDDHGRVHRYSAFCPHMQDVVCWNRVEKSWDCPAHGSRFSKDGLCVMGPSKSKLEEFS